MKYILFDLDGTLMDFNKGERNAFIKTIAHFNNYVPNEDEIRFFSSTNERLFNEFAEGKIKRIEFQERRFKEITDYMHIKGDISIFNKYYVEELKYQADLFDDCIEGTAKKIKKSPNL